MGDQLMKNASGNKTLGVGGFALMPANMNHFAFTTAAETEIVLYGHVPIDFMYVNPADDPRNVRTSTRWGSRRGEGIVYVTGPTGSRKTTTLYSALAEIDDAGVKISSARVPEPCSTRG